MFTASTVQGNKIGSKIGCPTINLDPADVPEELEQGVYAARVDLGDGNLQPATLHWGPRPTLGVGVACEVHMIGLNVPNPPGSLRIQIIEKLRDIQDFGSLDALKHQISQDIEAARDLTS